MSFSGWHGGRRNAPQPESLTFLIYKMRVMTIAPALPGCCEGENSVRPCEVQDGARCTGIPCLRAPPLPLPSGGFCSCADPVPARQGACLFPVRRRHVVDACWFVEQPRGLCRPGLPTWRPPALLVCCDGPLAGPEAAHPGPALGQGAHTAAWVGALCFPPLSTFPTASSLQPPGL